MMSPADAQRGVDLERLRFIIDNYQGTPYPLNRTSLREVFDELERLRQREVDCRECGESVERGEVVFHEECLDPAVSAARVALAQTEQPTQQQQVREAMADAYASDNPGSPRQRAVHVPLDNGA